MTLPTPPPDTAGASPGASGRVGQAETSGRSDRRRIIFLDVDGTLLEHGSHVSPSTGPAIRAVREAGHLVYLSTGRSASDIHPDVAEIGFDGAVTNSGALVVSGGQVVVDRPLSPAATDRMLTALRSRGIRYFLQTRDAVYASDDMAELMRDYAAALEAREAAGQQVRPEDSLVGLAQRRFPSVDEADLTRIDKAVFVSDHPEGLDELREDLGDEFLIVPGSMPLPGGSNGEISERETTKGSAIELLLAHLGMHADDAIAVGDSWNDIEMFQVCGVSVAMGNAQPELKELADFVTTDVLDDGIANALRRLGLI
ncbi:HAD family hydrolase [Microbacterium trichothecenolyticum]|uniref:Sugar phosphatase YidA n=1 Tax=Microbacterium trichothecenolyticum TaxID=69370 RepID=A0A0M2HEX7_MICTR|nr:HAD family hydrolase [Microbacterium trichothecenolyticum]KJL42807.1 Sugar phosphatase YidA [Microbacterium trichothecenolyticum]